MSKKKSRKIDRRRERRMFNSNVDFFKRIGHGLHTGWKRYIGKGHVHEPIKEDKE